MEGFNNICKSNNDAFEAIYTLINLTVYTAHGKIHNSNRFLSFTTVRK